MSIEVTIEKLVYGGEGLTRLPEGEVLFVPWSAPGDQVAIERVPGSTKPARGAIENVLQASPDRQTAKCSVFGACGGCQWQHMTPAAQRNWKREIVLESLTRIGKLNNPNVLETLGSDETAWHYRNRVQWELEPSGQTLSDKYFHQLGYYAAQSHDIVTFDQCHIIPESLNALALHIRQFATANASIATAILRIEAFQNQQGQILLTLEGEPIPELKVLVDNITTAFPQVVGITQRDSATPNATPTTLWGQDHLTETLVEHTFQVSAGSFFQTNPKGAEQLLAVLDEWLLPESQSMLDLYAGVGVFAIHFYRRMKRMVAIESSKSAMADAQMNLIQNQADEIVLKTGDARAILAGSREIFDVAIIDPPRGGCQPEVLKWLNQHVKQQLLYVSCNPTTLARDLKALLAQGWQLQAVQPIDMFPQTYHIECVANLIR